MLEFVFIKLIIAKLYIHPKLQTHFSVFNISLQRPFLQITPQIYFVLLKLRKRFSPTETHMVYTFFEYLTSAPTRFQSHRKHAQKQKTPPRPRRCFCNELDQQKWLNIMM